MIEATSRTRAKDAEASAVSSNGTMVSLHRRVKTRPTRCCEAQRLLKITISITIPSTVPNPPVTMPIHVRSLLAFSP